MYVANGSLFEKRPGPSGEQRYHLTLLAKNSVGYRNLAKLCSEGFLSGFYYKPRIDKELLAEYSEGLICMTGCLSGEIPQILLSGNMDIAIEAVNFYKGLFGEDFYIETFNHGIDEETRVRPLMAELGEHTGVKLVATNDAHYLKKEHAPVHDVLLCVGTQSKRDEENRFRFNGKEFYLKTPEEMAELFADYPQALETTLEIADKCNLEITLGESHFPLFNLPKPDQTADEFLIEEARKGLIKRFPDGASEEAEKRLEYELDIIKQTGFANYFLITADFVNWAKEQDIPVGPGRGSAAGCLVSYCLGITNINPLKYDLIFERFLNPERVSPPDIDIDFSDDRREEVIKYVRDKYGADSVCRIITFGTMATRSSVRDVARAMGLTYLEADKIAKLIPENVKDNSITKSMNEVPELKRLVQSDPRFIELMENAAIIEGSVRHVGTHAAGVVICPGPTVDFIPVCKQSDDNEVYTQYDMNWIDALGLLKMDFLGLQTLQELDLALKALKRGGIDIDFDDKDAQLDDPETFKLFGDGDTIGVFQFESGGMRKNLVKLKPERLEDLIAMNALYRPGPMANIPDFIDRKHGQKKLTYLHPLLEPILKDTYGVIVYQEQVIRIATDLGGFSLGKADNLRKAMGKKIPELMKSFGEEFTNGCISNGIDKKTAEAIYALMAQFAEYGFVKAHSAGYAVIAYQCAYLKSHYPAEYLAACLTVRSQRSDQVMKLLAECRSHYIPILPPDINESDNGFVATTEGIRFGMAAVKNVGEAAVKAILAAREEIEAFTSLHHFLATVDLRVINKRVIESLIEAGAFDRLGPNRATLLASLPGVTAYANAVQDEKLRNQTSFFSSSGSDNEEGRVSLPLPELHQMEEWQDRELQSREKAVLGYYISSHPLAKYKREIDALTTHRLADKDEFITNAKIKICVIISSVDIKFNKNGAQWAILKMEDLTGSIEAVIYSKEFKEFHDMLEPDRMIGIEGYIQRRDESEEPNIRVEKVIDINNAVEKWGGAISISLQSERVNAPMVDRLEKIVITNEGNCPLYIDLLYPGGDKKKLKLERYKVLPVPELIKKLNDLVGENQIQILP
jgi:DNA polymerase-3 subunit alpha